jgi:transcriptional regulator with XRE-family HTH domain
MSIAFRNLHDAWMKDRRYRSAYERGEPAFIMAMALTKARIAAGLTQEEVARRMGTSQAAVARLESGRHMPSLRVVDRYAAAVGRRLKIDLVAVTPKRRKAA